ncbi:hypothetical protein ColLi_13619 [Colletotrichum liriopes]|uniref:Uncharacterized protein n=1 Tax=Colletotrichum liriopes TaxID=708192 RepID=A0AA37H0I8_9PEZI|nr:hypothetical protein ColLi_13619 [Colletotrichum liriopes]
MLCKFLILLSFAGATLAQIDCTQDVHARLPIIARTHEGVNASWAQPPSGWVFGNWKVTWSSSPNYPPLHNFNVDLSPIFPQTPDNIYQVHDLSTYQINGTRDLTIYYGVDNKRADDSGIYNFTLPRGGLNYRLEILVWGYDTDGVGYKVTYENEAPEIQAPAALSIESRVATGPTQETVSKILAEVKKLGWEPLVTLAEKMIPLTHDDGRKGLEYVCDATCTGAEDPCSA